MTDKWHNITTCFEPGCPTRFRADHQHPKVCGWHGRQDDDHEQLTSTICTSYLKGLSA